MVLNQQIWKSIARIRLQHQLGQNLGCSRFWAFIEKRKKAFPALLIVRITVKPVSRMQLKQSCPHMSLYYPELGYVSCTIPALESVDSEAEQLQPVSEGCSIFSSEHAASVPACSAPLQVEGGKKTQTKTTRCCVCARISSFSITVNAVQVCFYKE